ncbi:MAG: glycosyltransferase family 4 protein [Gammaproteobacteria bacterium]
MKLAFCLFKYFPYGGLQRDFMRIADACFARGHDIHIYTMHWEGETNPAFHLHLLDVKGWSNHVRSRAFAHKVKAELDKEQYDLVIGFNKMPHLDVYYAADVCYQARVREQRSKLYRWFPRYKQLVALEADVFKQGQQTEIMLISSLQQPVFIHHYHTEKERFHLLPPGIAKDRIAPPNAPAIRRKLRDTLNIPQDDFILLMVGSGFKTKGLDRAILGLASLPQALKAKCHFLIVGQDNPDRFKKLAKTLQVEQYIQFLGGRPDVPDFLLAADLLLHPAYHENTGTVLLEALVAGLSVLTVDICGYAHYILEADVGRVLSSPFSQSDFNAELKSMLLSPEREQWKQNGLTFAQTADIYSMSEKAADLIESVGRRRAIS